MTSARQQAKEQGAARYFSGRPCKRGHVAERFTSCGYCVECDAARVAAKGESLLAYYRQRYRDNRDEILKAQRQQRQTPTARAARLQSTRAWQEANPDRVRTYKRKNKHKRRGAVGSFTEADIQALLRIQRCQCTGCSSSLRGGYHVDHIIPLARGGTNWCGNLQLLCPACNFAKSSRLPVEWRRSRLDAPQEAAA